MKIFVVGLPQSGRTSVAKSIAEVHGWHYIDAMSWVRSTFREPKEDEIGHQFEDEYQHYLSKRLMLYPFFIEDHVKEMMSVSDDGIGNQVYVIDGISSPKDFASLFDYRKDMVIFLNRVDNESILQDHENIGNSVIKDYCFWMAAAGLIQKKHWMEYNFRIPGEDSDHVKNLGAKNSVFIVKSIKKAIEHVNVRLTELVSELNQ